jgi:hypothetical protein
VAARLGHGGYLRGSIAAISPRVNLQLQLRQNTPSRFRRAPLSRNGGKAARPRRLSPGPTPGQSTGLRTRRPGRLTAGDRSESCGHAGAEPGVFHHAGRPVSSTQTRFFVLPTVGHGQPRPPAGCHQRSREGGKRAPAPHVPVPPPSGLWQAGDALSQSPGTELINSRVGAGNDRKESSVFQ